MKIYICCSKHFYNKIPEIKEKLEKQNHEITLPNSFDNPFREEEIKEMGKGEHIEWKRKMMKDQTKKIESNDAIMVLNFEKNGQLNYIGGATFMEIVKAWELGKLIYLYNEIPESLFTDEISAINPTIINGNLELLK